MPAMDLRLDPDRYLDKIGDSRCRIKTTQSFQEPDRVPIQITTGGSFYAKLFGCNIRDYYTDMDLNLEVQVAGLKWAFEVLGDDRTGLSVSPDIGPVSEGIYFGLPIEYPDDTSPWIVPQLSDASDIEKLEIPEPEGHSGVRRVYELYETLKLKVEKMGLKLNVSGGFGIHPPLSAACAIMPPEKVYELMYTDPPLVHRFFGKLLDAFCKLVDFKDRYFGTATESMGLADDNSAFISVAMYKEFVFPYNSQIYERYGKKGRSLHADGPNDHLFELYADEMKLTQMDIGGFSDIAAAKKAMAGKTVIFGGLNNRDLYGTVEEARPAIERALAIGAPGGGYIFGVGGETYHGVNVDTLCECVRLVKKTGRYSV